MQLRSNNLCVGAIEEWWKCQRQARKHGISCNFRSASIMHTLKCQSGPCAFSPSKLPELIGFLEAMEMSDVYILFATLLFAADYALVQAEIRT